MNVIKEYIEKTYLMDVVRVSELSGGWLNRKYLIENSSGKKYVFKVMSNKKVEKMSNYEYSVDYIEDKVLETLEIENFLNANGISCPKVITISDGNLLGNFENEKCFLMEYFAGTSVDFSNSVLRDLYLIGCELSKMHMILETIPYVPIKGRYLKLKTIDELEFEHTKRLAGINADISTQFFDVVVKHRKIIDELKTKAIIEQIPIGLIHGDFANDNILFNDETLCIIDFETIRENSPLQDIGKIILSLCLEKNEKLNNQKILAFLNGYNRNLSLSIDEIYKGFIVVWINEVDMWIKKQYFETKITPKAQRFIDELCWITDNWNNIMNNANFNNKKNTKHIKKFPF